MSADATLERIEKLMRELLTEVREARRENWQQRFDDKLHETNDAIKRVTTA